MLAGNSLASSVGKSEALTLSTSDLHELFACSAIHAAEETNDNGLITTQHLFKLISRGELLGDRASLRAEVLDNTIGFTGSFVIGGDLAVAEDLEGGESRNAEFVASALAITNAVDFSESNRWVVGLQDSGSSIILRRKTLAVTAPGSVKLDEDEVMLFDFIAKVSIAELKNVAAQDSRQQGRNKE